MRHAFQIINELGAECDRLGVRVVDVHGERGSASEFLAKIVAYIEARESECDRLSEAIRRLAEQDATLSVHGGNVTVTVDATLTDEEREAIESALGFCERTDRPLPTTDQIATLRGLLYRRPGQLHRTDKPERTHPGRH